MKRMMSIAMLALVGVAAACDSDDSTGPGQTAGSYDVTITGAIAESAQGPAWFGSDVNDDGDPVFALVMGDEDSRHLVIAGKMGSARPAVGTHPISAVSWDLVHMVTDGEDLIGMFLATEGEINITHSSTDALRGTIDFVATGLFGQEQDQITGTIEFDARRATAVQSLSAVRGLR